VTATNAADARDAADAADAARIAADAGRLLLEIRSGLEVPGTDPATVRREGDQRAHDLIVRALARSHPEDPVVSEEGGRPVPAAGPGRTWIVDPLDGTEEFGERGRTDWAVHVALVVDGRPVAGAVALPAHRLVLASHPAAVLARRDDGPVRLLVSRSRPPALIAPLAARLGARIVPMGSAGAKAMAVVRAEGDAYVHAGGQYEWDSAAPVAVAEAAGLHASRLDGSPLRYGSAGADLPDLVICRPEMADTVLAALADAAVSVPPSGPGPARG
jgi:3'(2'), 5'-bisphosphate nucleotidase